MPWMIDLTLRDPKTGDRVTRTLPAIDVKAQAVIEDAKAAVEFALPGMLKEAADKGAK